MNWNIVYDVIAAFGPFIMGLIGLIGLDILIGIALAIKINRFEWKKVAAFYRTNVIPYLIGWLGFAMITRLAAPEVFGEWGFIFGDGVIIAAWLAVVATLAGSIIKNAKELYGSLLPFTIPQPPPQMEDAKEPPPEKFRRLTTFPDEDPEQ